MKKKKTPKEPTLNPPVSFTSALLNTQKHCLENTALAAGPQSILKEYGLRQSRGVREGGAFETRKASVGSSPANTGREGNGEEQRATSTEMQSRAALHRVLKRCMESLIYFTKCRIDLVL